MSEKKWFLHLRGESVGPMLTSIILSMLKQKRLEPLEYIWTQGYAGWVRICDVPDFSLDVPSYPQVPVPGIVESDPDGALSPADDLMSPSEIPFGVKAKVVLASASAPVKNWPAYRKHERVRIQGMIEVTGYGSYSMVNLSESGIFVESDKALPVGTLLEFKLSSPEMGKPFEMTGEVARHGVAEGRRGFAIEFRQIRPAHYLALSDLISRKSSSPSNGPDHL